MNHFDGNALANRLNAVCQCVSLDRERLGVELERVSPGFLATVTEGRPHLFSDSLAFISREHAQRMAELIAAIERVASRPAYIEHVLGYAPEIARHAPGALGVFMGYDFHLGSSGPQLIEINTNAGGGLLNAFLARAQKACCDDVEALLSGALAEHQPEQVFVDMFRHEWSRGTRSASPSWRNVAIVDEAPQTQYLYPEFVLFQRLFESAGLRAIICAPTELAFRDGALWHGDMRIDLVYNRLTDFALQAPASAALRAAYLADAAVITPHPRAHALYADKRNLVALSDADLLARWGVDQATRAVLAAGIPPTRLVTAEKRAELWASRRQLFFKPAAGFGSRATYRGDKITTRVFDEILAGTATVPYVAQALVPPSLRTLRVGEASAEPNEPNEPNELKELKLDLRSYAYAGHVQLTAARLWQGQTTNFRTPGGGFAAVLEVPDGKATLAVSKGEAAGRKINNNSVCS